MKRRDHSELKEKTYEYLQVIYSSGTSPSQKRRARDRIIKLNTPLAIRSADRFSHCVPPTVATHDDLLQLCLIGISKAIDTYDENKGPFVPHMKIKMNDAMRKWRRDHSQIPRKAMEIYDAARSRQRFYKNLAGVEPPLERVAVYSLGVDAEEWSDILSGYHRQWIA